MAIRFTGLRRTTTVALIAAMIALQATAIVRAQQATATAAMQKDRATLDGIEATLKGERLSTQALIELGRDAAGVRDDLRARIEKLEPRLARVQTRLKQLGAPPAVGAPAEPTTLAAERVRLTSEVGALDAEGKQGRLLALRADQIADQITRRRFSAYTRELFARSSSVLDPRFWLSAAGAIGDDLGRGAELMSGWARFVGDSSRYALAAALLTLLGLGIIGAVVWRIWERRTRPDRLDTQRARIWQSCLALVRALVMMPLIVIVALKVLDAFALIPPDLVDIAQGLIVAVTTAAIGRAAAVGLLAADDPSRRLVPFNDRTARSLHGHVVAAARVLAVLVFTQVVHREIAAPQVIVVLTSTLFAIAVLIVMLHQLFQLRASAAVFDSGDPPGHLWIRTIAWLLAGAIAVALVSGHIRLAEFIAQRLITAVVIFALLYLLLKASDTLFNDVLAADSPRRRVIVANLGLSPRRVALLAELVGGLVSITLILIALAVVFGPWEGSATDLMAMLKGVGTGLTIGEATISLSALLTALAILAAGVVVTRAVESWLTRRLLPRTDLEPSLQQSVAVIIGYVGIIAAIALALGALGIDLQKIALVAGALSVGIGFGLQSIVSNFVSGLILLTERPIRVGDWIVAKGEEGFVRRIRVRATEVETFERASVIIPNSELISGVVKNWTHGNTMGRITIKVGVGYDSDPAVVRDILLAVADAHSGVLKIPPPSALFVAFGDSALEFELRCIVRDVQQSLVVRSDLNFAILAYFRQKQIDIPYPQRTVRVIDAATPAQDS